MKTINKLLAPIKKKTMNALVANYKWLEKQVRANNVTYNNISNNYETNIDTKSEIAAISSYKREVAINEILKSKEYDFDNMLVIKNPHRIAPLSALALFVTDMSCKVQYTIAGKRGSDYYTVCDEIMTKYHRVPLLGLYENSVNIIIVRLLDENDSIIASKKLRIIIRGLDKPVHNAVKLSNSTQPLSKDFIFVSGGYHGGVYAFDKKGNIRFALNKIPQYCGVYLFKDGRFLFPEKHMRRPAWGNANTVVMHEMDMMGRVYRTYYDKKGLHHWAIEKEPGGNILALSSSTDDTFMENEIVEIDRFTGEAVKEINMNQLLPEKYITRNDWAHINSIEYIAKDDSVVISMRNVHTIAKISLEKGELVWILTNPKFYKETNVEDKVLKPEGDIKWFFQQHAIQIVHDEKNKDGRLHIMLFDNHTANRRPVKWFDKEKKSNIMFFTIDEKNMTVTQDKYIPVPLSVTRSNEEYDTKTGKVFAMCANLKPPIDGYNGKIYEIDYNTGEITNEFSSELDYFSAHSIEFNINDMAKPLDFSKDMVVGELYAPVKAEGNAEDFTKLLDFDDIENNDDKPQICMYGELLQIRALDHTLEKIYLYNENDTYIQDFTDSEQTIEVFGTQHYYMSMPLMAIAHGNYKLAIKHNGKLYDTHKYINIF